MAALPTPNRSKYVPNKTKSPDDDTLDIGWYEGVLSDGRPYRAECWAQGQVTHLTFFVSTRGLEKAVGEQLLAILERDSLVRFTGSKV